MGMWIRLLAAAWSAAIACGVVLPVSAAVVAPAGQAAEAAQPTCARDSVEGCACAADGGRFSVDLLGIVSDGGRANALISPLGIRMVLAMLAQGAREPVRREIRALLQGGLESDAEAVAVATGAAGGGSSHASLSCRLAAVRASAGADDGVALHIASAAFMDKRLDVFPSFAAVLEDRFGARAERMDFEAADAVERINGWTAGETGGAIPELIRSLDPGDALLLVNALHFQGKWSDSFDPDATVPLPFHPHAGGAVDVDTMRAVELPARFRESGSFQAVAIPYGAGGFEAVIVLPGADWEPGRALRALASDPSWFGEAGFRAMRGSLALPRLSLDEEASVLPALRELGFRSYENHPDSFGGIAAPPPLLGRVIHRTVLLLEERGTEAAATTAAVLAERSLPVEKDWFEMRVDRPFAFAVRHRSTGALLFLAWVAHPALE